MAYLNDPDTDHILDVQQLRDVHGSDDIVGAIDGVNIDSQQDLGPNESEGEGWSAQDLGPNKSEGDGVERPPSQTRHSDFVDRTEDVVDIVSNGSSIPLCLRFIHEIDCVQRDMAQLKRKRASSKLDMVKP